MRAIAILNGSSRGGTKIEVVDVAFGPDSVS